MKSNGTRKTKTMVVLPYMGHKGFGISAVLVINRVSILVVLALNRVWVYHSILKLGMFLRRSYSGIPISRTSRGNANWFEKSGVREIEGGIKLRLISRVLSDHE